MILVYRYKEPIITVPPIPALDRVKINIPELRSDMMETEQPQLKSISFSLKRSGKIIRKVDASPSASSRNWKPLEISESESEESNNQALIGRKLLAEIIYISKPMAHLTVSACFGYNTWKPWMVSFIMDILRFNLKNIV